jgi:hypothetical protein
LEKQSKSGKKQAGAFTPMLALETPAWHWAQIITCFLKEANPPSFLYMTYCDTEIPLLYHATNKYSQ